MKRDMEELKKDVETVHTVMTVQSHKTFLENVNNLGILKKKPVHESTTSLMPPLSPD